MKTLLILVGALVSSWCHGQSTQAQSKLFLLNRAPAGFVSQLPMAPPQTLGDYYLQENWESADVFLTTGEKLEDIPVRLNLRDNTLEIKHEDQVKLLYASRIVSFIVADPTGNKKQFLNATSYKNPVKTEGFFRVIEAGKYSLMELTKTEVMQANYNAALDVGSKDHQIVKTKMYFLAQDLTALPVITNRKKMSKAFQDTFRMEISKSMESLDINLKKEEDLIALVRNLNRDNS